MPAICTAVLELLGILIPTSTEATTLARCELLGTVVHPWAEQNFRSLLQLLVPSLMELPLFVVHGRHRLAEHCVHGHLRALARQLKHWAVADVTHPVVGCNQQVAVEIRHVASLEVQHII